MVYGSIWLVALVKGAGSVAGLEDFDGRVRGFLQDVQVAVGPCGVGGKKTEKWWKNGYLAQDVALKMTK